VGAGIAIKRPGIPTVKLKYRMDTWCSNNQAEAFAILKALEFIQTTQTNEEDNAVTVNTDSMTTVDSLINTDIHTFLTEEIRQAVHKLETREWKIRFRWVKAHAGTSGNELADKLAKQALGKTDLLISYNRVPKSVIKRDLEDTSVETWQREWDKTTKGRITKDYFPKVSERLHTKLHLTQNFTTIVTGHGNIKSYLHRFKIIDAPNCPCGNDNQTTQHILLECAVLHEDRERLIAAGAEEDSWPINKDKLIKRHYKAFAKCMQQLDKIKEMNTTRNKHSGVPNVSTRRRPKDKRKIKTKSKKRMKTVNTKCKQHVVLLI